MRTLHRVLAAVGTSAAIATGLATTAAADGNDSTGEREDSALTAMYRGEVVSVDEALEAGAAGCSQQASADVEFRCYEDAVSFRAGEGMDDPVTDVGTLDKSDCRPGYLCLWDNRNYGGGMVDFNRPGRYVLEGFKDRANSVYSRRPSVSVLIDTEASGPSWGLLVVDPGQAYRDLGAQSTNWNNKVDEVDLAAP